MPGEYEHASLDAFQAEQTGIIGIQVSQVGYQRDFATGFEQ